MNGPLVRWLFDVESIPADAEQVSLAWEQPWPGWVWAVLVLAAAVFAAWSYSRLTGSRVGKVALAGLRFAVIVLVLVLISGPMLRMPRETVEEDWVLVLIDQSASMNIADVVDEGERRITRDEQIRRALAEHADVFAGLSEQKQVVWLGFHVGAFSLDGEGGDVGAGEEALPVVLGEPDGRRTSINTTMMQALQRAAARPLSGVVLISDGRTHDPPTRATLRRLQADAVPVFTVPIGSTDALADLTIQRIDAPRRAYIGDKVPINVQLDRAGMAVGELGATITLVDELTGEELAREQVAAGDERETVTLTAEPAMAGETTWRVQIETEQPALVPENMVRTFGIELIDRPLRVLFVDGYPRWEYRYLKNLLIQEESLESSIMLLSADREFAQEGDLPITRLPRSPGELADYDVIVLGDVPASFFSTEQLELIRDHVADYGAGVLWVAGPRSTPDSFVGTALADLLPVRGSGPIEAIGRPVLMTPTPLATRLGVLQLTAENAVGWPQELVDEGYGWSRLHYAQRLDPDRLKPTVEVLAETTESFRDGPLPLVTMMRYGAGRSVYVATDEIWRWRYGRGELLPEQFWVQLMRMLGRDSVAGPGQQAILEINPARVGVGEPLRIDLRLLDDRLAMQQLPSVAAELINDQDEAVAEVQLMRVDGVEERFAATYIPDAAGRYRVRLTDPSLAEVAEAGSDAEAEVFTPDDEMRQPETDHAMLSSLAETTGGRVVMPDELGELPAWLPNRALRTVNPLTERIWDTPFFFIVMVVLLTAEWIGRKIVRLV